jgi:hypothetical protein
MSRPLSDFQAQPGEALRVHLERLVTLHASLETAEDISPSERRALGEHILGRVAQVGLLLRQRPPERSAPARPVGSWMTRQGLDLAQGMAGPLTENSGLLIGLLGGLVVAFAVGRLLGYHRGILQASYYGEGDPRIRFLARPPSHLPQSGEGMPVTFAQVRETLAAGRTVLLQMGYEIAPSQRARFLELARQVQRVLSMIDGQAYTVWEDPKHPNRFYEVLVCRRLAALNHLAATDGPLARLAEELEACRLPGGVILRRAWCGVLPEPEWMSLGAPDLETSMVR